MLTNRRHMARDEMETITEDRWNEEIWGTETGHTDHKNAPPKLVFYFGQNVRFISMYKSILLTHFPQDHWVADHTRDALIESRGSVEVATPSTKPVMIIDQDNIPHGFCLSKLAIRKKL